MGSAVSAIASGVDSILTTIGNAVTDAGTTVAHLQMIAQDMLVGPPPPQTGSFARANARRGLHVTSPVMLFARAATAPTQQDVQTALKTAMDSAKSAAATLFKTQFGQAPAGTDMGVVNGYNPNGSDLSSVITQITNDFSIWNLPLSNDQITSMAATLQSQVQAQMGRGGASWGKFVLNMNQTALWTVGYGMFQISPSSQGLIYGFSGAMDSGFGD